MAKYLLGHWKKNLKNYVHKYAVDIYKTKRVKVVNPSFNMADGTYVYLQKGLNMCR